MTQITYNYLCEKFNRTMVYNYKTMSQDQLIKLIDTLKYRNLFAHKNVFNTRLLYSAIMDSITNLSELQLFFSFYTNQEIISILTENIENNTLYHDKYETICHSEYGIIRINLLIKCIITYDKYKLFDLLLNYIDINNISVYNNICENCGSTYYKL